LLTTFVGMRPPASSFCKKVPAEVCPREE
jgi:hypothetical protein